MINTISKHGYQANFLKTKFNLGISESEIGPGRLSLVKMKYLCKDLLKNGPEPIKQEPAGHSNTCAANYYMDQNSKRRCFG